MKVREEFEIKSWNRDKFLIKEYWKTRNVALREGNDETLNGRRGGIFGNLFSFNMQKLITEISVKKISEKRIEAQLHITTTFQTITDSNRQYWEMEMKEFREYLASGKLIPKEWQGYKKKARRSDIKWVLGLLLFTILYLITFKVIETLK